MDYINIGNVKIKKTAALAPMAGVADTAFRTTAKRFGASYVVGEMVSIKGLAYSDRKSAELLTITDAERPAAVQLFGSEPEFVPKAVEIAERWSPDIIDFNAGCPVPKVAGNGAGSALMKDPKLFGEMVAALVKAAHVPVTVKIRAGWDAEHINAVEIARIAEECGASAVAVHARTKTQMYSGSADRSVISAVKKAVSIPVIGNGDVTSVESCVSMYRETDCDLVMIARGAYGNPWLFRDIDDFFEGRERKPAPTLDERLDVMREQIELLVKCKGEFIGMKEARAQAAFYLKGMANAAKYRGMCGKLSKKDDLYELIRLIKSENGNNDSPAVCE
ncbi:MAG: tRNA dihydrouridine synthase DusB [Ruminiclostridium sp.]|nr:tRNA dihydrouridine synthase DusB [Ruminiclostridium sp.]